MAAEMGGRTEAGMMGMAGDLGATAKQLLAGDIETKNVALHTRLPYCLKLQYHRRSTPRLIASCALKKADIVHGSASKSLYDDAIVEMIQSVVR